MKYILLVLVLLTITWSYTQVIVKPQPASQQQIKTQPNVKPVIKPLKEPIPVKTDPTSGEITILNETAADADGNTYGMIKIGTQTWMMENLRTTHYNDGTEITEQAIGIPWVQCTTGAYHAYLGSGSSAEVSSVRRANGLLYNSETVKSGKLAPVGWHIPSKD